MGEMKRYQWPKQVPSLTPEQKAIADDFMQYTHEVLPKRFGAFYRFNHGYPAKNAVIPSGCRTLEIGPGIGEHMDYENMDTQEYYCVEMRQNMLDALQEKYPRAKTLLGDCQKRLPFEDGFFHRIIAIHVLEHLPDLPSAIEECCRLLNEQGTLDVVIPCDPGWLYESVRKLTTERMFKKRYAMSYRWLVESEHINSPKEVIIILQKHFVITKIRYFPFLVPMKNLNLCIGLQLRKNTRLSSSS